MDESAISLKLSGRKPKNDAPALRRSSLQKSSVESVQVTSSSDLLRSVASRGKHGPDAVATRAPGDMDVLLEEKAFWLRALQDENSKLEQILEVTVIITLLLSNQPSPSGRPPRSC